MTIFHNRQREQRNFILYNLAFFSSLCCNGFPHSASDLTWQMRSTVGIAPKVLNPELGRARAEQTLTENETLVRAAAASVNFSQVVSLGDHGDSSQALSMRMRSDPALTSTHSEHRSAHRCGRGALSQLTEGCLCSRWAPECLLSCSRKASPVLLIAQPPAHQNHSQHRVHPLQEISHQATPQRNTA